VLDQTKLVLSTDAVDFLACETLAELYRVYCGTRPVGVRAYRDEDHDEEALLLLLRFEPEGDDDGAAGALEPLVETALRAMPAMISSAVEARTGCRLAPGNLSLCSGRGLAVFAFSVLEDGAEEHGHDDLFQIDADRFRPSAAAKPAAARLAG
jgi:hypothetical protein